MEVTSTASGLKSSYLQNVETLSDCLKRVLSLMGGRVKGMGNEAEAVTLGTLYLTLAC